MELNRIQNAIPENGVISHANVIPLKEAGQYFDSNINQEEITAITNNLVGIVDSVLNTYINSFRC